MKTPICHRSIGPRIWMDEEFESTRECIGSRCALWAPHWCRLGIGCCRDLIVPNHTDSNGMWVARMWPDPALTTDTTNRSTTVNN